MKKYLILSSLVILILLCGKFLPLKDYFYESLINLNIVKRCFDKSSSFSEIFASEGLNYELYDRSVTKASLTKLLDIETSPNALKIPLITHHIYLTSTNTPIPLNDFYIEKIRANFAKLNALSNDWQHFIWTNNPEIIPKELKSILGVQIKQPEELVKHSLFKELADIINKGEVHRPYFAEGADLLRLMCVQTFGGIYNDMDYEIYDANSLFNLMKRFDFIGGREMSALNSYYGNAFIAAKANHPVMLKATEMNTRNYAKIDAPDYIKYPCKESARIYFNGPPLITIAYFLKNNIDGNSDIILPSWMIFNAHFARFKNKICNYKEITKEEFIDNNNHLNNLLKEYSINAKTEGGESMDPALQNIYYNTNYRDNLPIIGADMFCGNWIIGNKFKRNYFWNW
jgi:hypothetical protein